MTCYLTLTCLVFKRNKDNLSISNSVNCNSLNYTCWYSTDLIKSIKTIFIVKNRYVCKNLNLLNYFKLFISLLENVLCSIKHVVSTYF